MSGWFLASAKGDTPALVRMISNGIDPNTKGDYGETALTMAVLGRHLDALRVLLSSRADPNVCVAWGWTAMTFAAIEAKGWRVCQDLCLTYREPDRRPLELLHAAGGRLGLREAVLLNDVGLAEALLEQDRSINVNGSARFSFDRTFLMLAAQLGHLDVFNLLVSRGAEIEGEDDLGHTSLMRAARTGQRDIVERLIQLGADINRGWPDDTALSQAEESGHAEIARLLISYGARRRLVDAIDSSDLNLARRLLESGSNPEGTVPLHYYHERSPGKEGINETRLVIHAIRQRNAEMLRLLLEFGASPQLKDEDHYSPLVEAVAQYHIESIVVLLQSSADLRTVGRDGLMAWEWAHRRGYDVLAEELKTV